MENKTPNYPYEHSVIVLTHTRPNLINARIEEIFRHYAQRSDIELIVFDNASNYNRTIRLSLLGAPPRSTIARYAERSEKNLGFGGGWNSAVARSRGRIIHLLSDDVRVTGDFVSVVERAALHWGGPDWLIGQRRVMAGGWNQFNGFTIPYLMGYYLAMPRTVWDQLGGFDAETFYPYDFEDVDLSHKAAQNNVALLTTPDLPLVHEVAGTIGYNPARFEHTVRMRAKFAAKWGLPNLPERP